MIADASGGSAARETVGAQFDGRVTIASRASADLHFVDRAMPGDVSAVVEQQAIRLALGRAHAAADHLNVERRRHRGANKGDHVDDGRIKSSRQHVTRGDALHPARLEASDDDVAFAWGGFAHDHLC